MAKSIWMNITTEDGVLIERIDISEYDLGRGMACDGLMDEIKTAKGQAEDMIKSDAIERIKASVGERWETGISQEVGEMTAQQLDDYAATVEE